LIVSGVRLPEVIRNVYVPLVVTWRLNCATPLTNCPVVVPMTLPGGVPTSVTVTGPLYVATRLPAALVAVTVSVNGVRAFNPPAENAVAVIRVATAPGAATGVRMVTATACDALPEKFALPAYMAVTLCTPGFSVLTLYRATPAALSAGLAT